MSAEVEVAPDQTAAALVRGILGDLQQLVEQQLLLSRRQIELELRQRASALALFALGLVVLFLDSIIFCLACAHLLHWMASPGIDTFRMPLWACYCIVTAVLLVVGATLTIAGKRSLRVTGMSPPSTTDLVQENTQ